MLTGEKPFKAETYTGYIQKHIHEKPALPSKLNPNIPSYLEKIILKCLEKDKRDRYQNAEKILHDLEEQKVATKPRVPQINVKKLLKVAYASIFVLLIILITYLIFKPKPPSPITSDNWGKSVAVMPFDNNTGDENQDNWRIALSTMLINDLIQSKLIRVLPDNRLFEILVNLNLQDAKSYTLEDLRKVAEQGRVGYVLTGNFYKAEGTLRIDTKLQNIITGDVIDSYTVEGEGEATFLSAVDDITPWVKSQLDFTSVEIAADPDRNIDEILTGSKQALTYYDQGKQYYQQGEFEKSNEALEQALKIDSGFVIAYKRISENYHYLDNIDQAKNYARKALDLLEQDRASLRERHLIEGWALTILEDSYDKAIETYEKLLQSYPDDEDGNTYLGAIYRNMEKWDLAIERFEKVLNLNPGMAVDNLIFIYKARGFYDKALEILNAYSEVYDDSSFRSQMSDIYFCEGRIDLALREAEIAVSLTPEDENTDIIRLTGNIHHIKDDFLKAEENYRRLLEKSFFQDQLSGRFRLGYLYLSQGNYEKSKKEVLVGIEGVRKSNLQSTETEFLLFLAYLNLQKNHYTEALNLLNQTEEIADEINLGESKILAMSFRGLTFLEMKNLNEAKRTAEELKQWVEKTGIQITMRYYYFLTGMIAKEEGMFSQSINDLELSFSMLPHQQGIIDEHAFYLNSLASAYYQIGNLEKARELYEKIISLTTGRLQWGDIYAKSFYQLGKICQEKGWEGKAIEHYEKFLQLWKNADPDLPETEDARKQLTVLRNTSRE
jgi:tetratricopeptide (TPR) repeat protein